MPAKASAPRRRREPNRLHRSTERWEDALALLLGLLLVTAGVIGFATGSSVHDSVAERARTELADRTSVAGVVTEDTVMIAGADRTGARSASVRWVGRDGVEHSGTTPVPGVRHAGEPIALWEGRDGRLMSAPTAPGDAATAGVLVGVLTTLAGGLAVATIGWGLFAWTGRRFARAWEQEWERVGPEWTGRARF